VTRPDCREVSFSNHALWRLFERAVHPNDIAGVVRNGEVIEERPDDYPLPSYLLLGTLRGEPIHVVIGFDNAAQRCRTITVYWPDPARWSEDFRVRRR
jgi:hypothetical protein